MRMIIEVDVEITDPTWTVQTVLENMPTYVGILIDDGEARERMYDDGDQSYSIDVHDITLWVDETYLDEIAQIAAMSDEDRAGLLALKALPPRDRWTAWMETTK